VNARPILQVEDDENDVYLLRYAFAEANISNALHPVRDANAAMEYLRAAHLPSRNRDLMPCLVIADLKLGRQTGFDLVRWIRSEPGIQTLPVLILSASASPRDVHEAYLCGANSFLVKPSNAQELTELARAIKVFWLQASHLPSEEAELEGTTG